MPIICIHSPKGGVGKSTLCANLAHTFSNSGIKVLAIDFDVQNALGVHFGLPLLNNNGYVSKSLSNADWGKYVQTTPNNIFVLPYGNPTEEERLKFEENLLQDKQFLTRGLNSLFKYPGLVIIADLPSGPSPALSAMRELADVMLVPLLSDTASLSLLPKVENQPISDQQNTAQQYIVVNQVDSKRKVNRDVTAFMKQRLGEKLLGVIHKDESVIEAHAIQKLISDFNSSSSAAFDIDILSKKITSILGIKVGDGTIHTSKKI